MLPIAATILYTRRTYDSSRVISRKWTVIVGLNVRVEVYIFFFIFIISYYYYYYIIGTIIYYIVILHYVPPRSLVYIKYQRARARSHGISKRKGRV